MTNLNAELFQAILERKLGTVSRLVSQGADVNAQDSSGFTPVHYAISADQPVILRYLLASGAKVRVSSSLCIPMFYAITACEEDNGKIIRILFEGGADVNEIITNKNYTPLLFAAMVKKPETARVLIAAGADLNARDSSQSTPFIRAVSDCSHLMDKQLKISSSRKAKLELIKLLVESGADPSEALMKIVSNSKFAADQMLEWKKSTLQKGSESQTIALDMVRSLLGPDKSAQENEDDLQIVKLLIHGGIEPDLKDSEGNTLLVQAVSYGSEEIISLLLDAGVDPDSCNLKGETALMFSAMYKNPGTLQRLIGATKDINMQDEEGRTALHYAVLFNRPENLSMLLDAGIKAAIRTDKESTALDLAVDRNYQDMVKMLIYTGDDLIISWGLSGLRKAVMAGNESLIPLFIDSGIGTDDSVSWYLARGMRNKTIMEILEGPESNVCYKLHWDGVEEDEDSPLLHKFASYGETELVRFLLRVGEDIHKKDKNGETALSKALRYDRQEVVELLRSSGAEEV